jgi:hypothetical protein
MRERFFPNVSKCLRRLTATTSFVREAAEGASSDIVYLKKSVDDQTVPRGGIYSRHFQGHRENTTAPVKL